MTFYQPELKTLKVLFAGVLLLSSAVCFAEPGRLDEERDRSNPGGDIVADLYKPILKNTLKFAYAELVYQRIYGADKFFVNGKNLSEPIKKSVSQVKYRDEALEIMGAEGWELSATVVREVTGGFEIFYYFKKQID